MKRRLAILLCAGACLASAADGSMSPAERTYLLDQLETTKKNLLASIHGLTSAQWKFKPAPAVWSVEECAEHIILAEDYIFGFSQQVLKSPVVARPAESDADHDRQLVARIEDRSKKATAPEAITPSGKFETPADAAREFVARRDKTIAYVKSSDDPLRVHVADGPAGKMDGYQVLLLLVAHSARHTAQLKEVQANPDYPKASAAR
jgi:hypothetical protein